MNTYMFLIYIEIKFYDIVYVSGWRIGKGEGYADLEYGMMRCMGAVDENTPVITTVHDCQVWS